MVSVRKSHLLSEASFDDWLSRLTLSESKQSSVEALCHKVKNKFQQNIECETKSLEMVEILSDLNLDTDSLCAAFLVPLCEYKLITLDDIKVQHGQAIYLLCKGVVQMEAIKRITNEQKDYLGFILQ